MKKSVMKYILNWVEDNIYTNANISHLVSSSGYSRKTLELWFMKSYGLTLGSYLMRRRMTRAGALLRMTSLPVIEIASMLHFYSPQNFTRAFKKLTGLTPTEYREQEEWLLHLLQAPISLGDANNLKIDYCELPMIDLHGTLITHKESFLSSSYSVSAAKKIKDRISKISYCNNREICVACKATPSASLFNSREMVINVEIIVHDPNSNSVDEIVIIPSGNYAQFQFQGTWDEYFKFTRLVYFKLASDKLHRRKHNSFDLSFFYLIDDDIKKVRCRFLVPIC